MQVLSQSTGTRAQEVRMSYLRQIHMQFVVKYDCMNVGFIVITTVNVKDETLKHTALRPGAGRSAR